MSPPYHLPRQPSNGMVPAWCTILCVKCLIAQHTKACATYGIRLYRPRHGTELGTVRPILVIQTDLINTTHASTLVCSLTTHVQPDAGILRVPLRKGAAGLEMVSDIMIDQLRTIENCRVKRTLGRLSSLRLNEVEEKIRAVLDLV